MTAPHWLSLGLVTALLIQGIKAKGEADPFAEPKASAPDAGGMRELDHLVPVDPYPGDWSVRYSDKLRKLFVLEPPFSFRMLVRPSFSAEYVVSMINNPEDPGDSNNANKLIIKYSIADKSIWYSMPENNEEKKEKAVTVDSKFVEFPKAQGTRLYKIWNRMLRQTRYPEGYGDGGLDGTTYEFSTWCAYGEVWSPTARKSPLLFIELGESLIAYCKATDEERVSAMKNIEAKAAKLEKYLDQHASK